MNKDLESLLFDYNKRQEMKNHPIFIQIREIWEKEEFSSPQKIGNLNYLIKQLHENKSINNKEVIVQQKDWINFYFNSGKKRKTEAEVYQSNVYYGRTIEELYDIAMELQKVAIEKGFKINEQAAFNIVYIKIIDDTFSDYMRCYRVIFRMKERYPEISCEMAKPLESNEYGVDIIIKLQNKLIGAIKVFPRGAIKKKEEIEKNFTQKHYIFKSIYEIDTYFVYSSTSGYIAGDLPKL